MDLLKYFSEKQRHRANEHQVKQHNSTKPHKINLKCIISL